MNLVLWCIYAAVTLFAIIFSGLREFHMLQLNGYKTPEHSWWMKKNIRRYIPLMIFLVIQLMLLPLERVLTWECEKHVLNYTKLRLAYGITGFLTAANIGIAIANKPGIYSPCQAYACDIFHTHRTYLHRGILLCRQS